MSLTCLQPLSFHSNAPSVAVTANAVASNHMSLRTRAQTSSHQLASNLGQTRSMNVSARLLATRHVSIEPISIKENLTHSLSSLTSSTATASTTSSSSSSSSSITDINTGLANAGNQPISLSPSIQVNANEFRSILSSLNRPNQHSQDSSTAVWVDTNTQQQPLIVQSASSSLSTQQSKETEQVINNNDTTTATGNKKIYQLGKYLLVESSTNNDTLNLAYHVDKNKIFFWKKLNKRDYIKKLEPYFIMEGSEFVHKFCEIILDESVSQAFDSTETAQCVYVMYEQNYGDLHTYMKEKKRLSESEARRIFRQCVMAVRDCHENGIIIRDIKLKKFVFLDADKTRVGLTNLEDCLVLDEDAPNDLIRSQQGCPAYVSPEVLNSQQAPYSGMRSDSWSLGIVLFTLLFGRYPFHHQVITNMFSKIARAKFQTPPTPGLSMSAKVLLRSLIRLKPEERLLSNEILAHDWFKQPNGNEHSFSRQTSATDCPMASLAAAVKTTASTNGNSSLINNFFQLVNETHHKQLLGISASAPSDFSLNHRTRPMKRQVETDDDNDCVVPVSI